MINTNFNVNNNINWWNTGTFNNNRNAANNTNFFGSNNSNISSAARTSLLNLRRTADTVTASLNAMRNVSNNSPFGLSGAISGNTDVLNIASVSANRLRSANADTAFSVDVVQLATAQRNQGEAMTASASAVDAGFTAGANQIALDIGGRQFDINFNVGANDTVRDVQQRIATAINSRNLGVQATVTAGTGAAAGTSTLALASAETGVNRAGQPNFAVRDVTGNAAAATGITNITQEAQNAQFRVNRGFTGTLQTSRSNNVDVGLGIRADLQETGRSEITLARDLTGQQNAFRSMVNAFNDLMEVAQDSGAGRLGRELTGLARSFGSSLNRVGITMNRDGFMQINEDRMRAAAESGELERFAARSDNNSNFGFVNRLARTAGNVSRNPGAFVQNDTNFSNSWFNPSPAQFGRMNRLMNIGMLFDTSF